MGSSSIHCFLYACLVLISSCYLAFATEVSYDGRAITIDGQRRILVSGSIHYPRSTAEMWPDLVKKAKEGGLDAIETYIFWNAHEPVRRQYDFSGNLDFIRFLKTVQDEGLYVVLRIGPYVCAEWNYGGFPVWLHNIPGIELRTANSIFMNEMQNFTTLIVDMVKQEKLFASQGGPIILAQIENEYGNVMSSYGAAGQAYIDWCANMATSLNIGVPWIMCQQPNAPQPIINTCNGWYCHDFQPNNPDSPKMWTENWTGWFKSWGGPDPYRTAEDVAYAVARFFQTGGSFQNYYMYHGGTNFGRVAGGPYISTTYDYDAPLDEYGNLNQPKYGHLKQLHDTLHSLEKILTSGNVTNVASDYSTSATIFSLGDTEACFLVNENRTADNTVSIKGVNFVVPAWSVSILPDCKNEVYNTAKVTSQTSVMERKSNAAETEPAALTWSWQPETIQSTVLQNVTQASVNYIMDQKAISDVSDYLWYMTSLNLDKNDPIWSNNMTLRVNGTGQIMHAFVNGEYLGSQWATYGIFNYVFEKNINLTQGSNLITLLSATVGLQNYGAFFDVVADGLTGPVEIVGYNGDETITKDLSHHTWSYAVGLNGIGKRLFSSENPSPAWQTQNLPTNRKFTWYKTTFKAPLENDPVVVDFQGLSKGLAWINGNSLGRYWPSFVAAEGPCSSAACDYRGPYDNSKCVTGCGEPSQRWYHVPRSFLKDDENELVLFEEFGGDPSRVNFQTVAVGSACGNVEEKKVLELSCNGRPISAVKFASFGNSRGSCGSFEKGSCEATTDPLSVVQSLCVGKESCTLNASERAFGSTNCENGAQKRLAVEVLC